MSPWLLVGGSSQVCCAHVRLPKAVQCIAMQVASVALEGYGSRCGELEQGVSSLTSRTCTRGATGQLSANPALRRHILNMLERRVFSFFPPFDSWTILPFKYRSSSDDGASFRVLLRVSAFFGCSVFALKGFRV